MYTGLRHKSSQTHASASAPHLSVYLGKRMTSVRGAFLFARPSFGGRSLLSELSEDGGFRSFLRTGVGELVDSSRLRLALVFFFFFLGASATFFSFLLFSL